MSLTYPIDVKATRGRWYLYDTETQEDPVKISGNGNWPNGDGSEIIGLGQNLIPLLATTQSKPDGFDHRLNRLVASSVIDLEANEFRKEWTVEPRSMRERMDLIDEIEVLEMGRHFKEGRLLLETTLLLGALLRANDSLVIPPAIHDDVERYKSRAEKIFRNRITADDMRKDVKDGIDPTLDQDFESPIEEVEST